MNFVTKLNQSMKDSTVYVDRDVDEKNKIDNAILRQLCSKQWFDELKYDGSLEFVSESDNDFILENINKTRPSDYIQLTIESADFLKDIWINAVKSSDSKDILTVPSDLFFAGTVPLMDCEIMTVSEDGEEFINSRIVIFENYQEVLKESKINTLYLIGAAIVRIGGLVSNATLGIHNYPVGWDFVIPIMCLAGKDGVIQSRLGWLNIPASQRAIIMEGKRHMLYSAQTIAGEFLGLWYGIQLTLLHPKLKTVFDRPKLEMVKPSKKPNKNQRRKIKYTKRHVIRGPEFSNIINGPSSTSEDRSYNRKTMAWYVIGHWREYADGRKTFVKGHWKGILRDFKENLDEGRERIVDANMNMEQRVQVS